jgi:hypothetical protein
MKAKKTEPKSIRLNKEHLEAALGKSKTDSIQELIDMLLSEYVKERAPVVQKEQQGFKLKNWIKTPEDLDGISSSSNF